MEFLAKGIQDTNVKAYYDFMVDAAVMFGMITMCFLYETLNYSTAATATIFRELILLC